MIYISHLRHQLDYLHMVFWLYGGVGTIYMAATRLVAATCSTLILYTNERLLIYYTWGRLLFCIRGSSRLTWYTCGKLKGTQKLLGRTRQIGCQRFWLNWAGSPGSPTDMTVARLCEPPVHTRLWWSRRATSAILQEIIHWKNGRWRFVLTIFPHTHAYNAFCDDAWSSTHAGVRANKEEK